MFFELSFSNHDRHHVLRSLATRAEVLAADELLLSSATKEMLLVNLLDGKPVGKGSPGPVYHKLYAAYQQAIQEQSP